MRPPQGRAETKSSPGHSPLPATRAVGVGGGGKETGKPCRDQTGGESADRNLPGMLGAPNSIHALDTKAKEAEKPLDPVTWRLLASREMRFQ